jgi:hypothetical protein
LVVEDVSLCCPAIGGLPGPYIKDFLKAIGDQGLYELIHKYPDHSVQVICIAAYIAPHLEPILFEGVVEGKIVAPRGQTRHGTYSWNPIVQPAGSSKTFGEMTMKEHSRVSMRYLALSKLKKYLMERSELILNLSFPLSWPYVKSVLFNPKHEVCDLWQLELESDKIAIGFSLQILQNLVSSPD